MGNEPRRWLSRRSFLGLGITGAAVGTGLYVGLRPGAPPRTPALPTMPSPPELPIGAVRGALDTREFLGDVPHRAHGALWGKAEYLGARGGVPRSGETARVVIVGGGAAGLCAAWALRDLQPVLLEQAPQLGGNARAERWEDVTCALGAAYVTAPDEGSALDALLGELGLRGAARDDDGRDAAVLAGGRLAGGFWEGATDPPRAAEFARVRALLDGVREERYPEIPRSETCALSPEELAALDRETLHAWLTREAGGRLHPHVEALVRQYCWSSFAARLDELSAAQGLNFLAADLGGTLLFPGGNAAILQALAERLGAALPSGHLRGGCLAVDVAPTAGGARVTYEGPDGQLRAVDARAVILACPKFVAARLVDALPAPQRAAMGALRYRAYVVANLLVSRRVPSPAAEAWCLTLPPADAPLPDEAAAARASAFCDVVFASWAAHDAPGHGALTLYRPFPYEGARAELLAGGAHDALAARMRAELPELLAALGVREDEVRGLRLARFGHALPLAAPGLLADGTAADAARPVDDRLFFAQQDNLASPCFEVALESALAAAAGARRAAQG